MSVKHAFVSAKTDGSDNTLVQPGDWNDYHLTPPLAYPIVAAPVTVADPPSGAADLGAAYRASVDLTHGREIRLVANVTAALPSGAKLAAEYSTDGSAWTAFSPAVEVAVDATGLVRSGGVAAPAGAKADVWVRLVTTGGDGVADLGLASAALQEGDFADAGGGPTTFAADEFTDTNGTLLQSHTATDSGTWTKHADSGNDVVINGNRAHQNGAGSTGGVYYHSATPPSADYSVFADVVVRSDNNSSDAGVVGRVAAGASTYYLARYNTGTNDWELWKRVAGTWTQLGAGFDQALTVDQAYRLELRMAGTSIKLLVDGVERVSVADAAITAAGKAGVRTANTASSTVGVHLDDFEAVG